MRRIRDPKKYVSPARAGEMLRELAAAMEKRPEHVKLDVRVSFATRGELGLPPSPGSEDPLSQEVREVSVSFVSGDRPC